MPEGLFSSIAVVQIPVKDLAAAERWYTDKLGLAKSFEMPEAKVVAFDVGGASLGLFEVAGGPAGPTERRSYPMLRPHDLDKTHEILRSRGVSVGPIEGGGPYRWFRLTDPDGNPLEALARA